MLVLDEKKKRVEQAYTVLRRILRQFGHIVSLPKNTDPSKTYSWRYVQRFVDSFDTLGLDESNMPEILEAVVIDARNKGLLKCGISFLNKVDLLEASHKKLVRDVNDETQAFGNIERSHNFLIEQLASEENEDYNSIKQLLLAKKNKRGYANITRWLGSGQISKGYLAVSKVCKRVMNQLDTQQLESFPTSRQLLMTRMKIQCREQMWKNLQTILGDDLFEE